MQNNSLRTDFLASAFVATCLGFPPYYSIARWHLHCYFWAVPLRLRTELELQWVQPYNKLYFLVPGWLVREISLLAVTSDQVRAPDPGSLWPVSTSNQKGNSENSCRGSQIHPQQELMGQLLSWGCDCSPLCSDWLCANQQALLG